MSYFALVLAVFCGIAAAQTVTPSAAPQTAPTSTEPVTITLEDALARAKRYGLQLDSANLAIRQAKEDVVQAKAARLPTVNAFNQFIYTEGNGTPSGVFVANDGVHVYNEQAIVHEDLLAFLRRGDVQRTMAAQAVAQAKAEVAARGLNATVVQDYFAIVAAQRRSRNAETSLHEAERFVDLSQKQEKGGEVAHVDVIKAQIQLAQRQRDQQDAILAAEKARIALAVLIFPDFRQDYNVVDDLGQPGILPPLPEARAQAIATSPDLKAAQAGVNQAGFAVNVAKYAYLPSFGLDFFYGIDANQFAARNYYPREADGSRPYRQNLGYVAQATLNIPIWDWGSIRSKVKQARLREDQAKLDLTLAQRQLQANLASFYREAEAARAQVDSLRQSSEMAAENLRLTVLRYQAGESTALEVVDAQSTLALARNAYDDGQVRYRVALANLQTLTGNF